MTDQSPAFAGLPSRFAMQRGDCLMLTPELGVLRLLNGHVEIYAEAEGRRIFLALQEPGALLLGCDCVGCGLMMLAVAPAVFDRLPPGEEGDGGGLDMWVEGLSAGLGHLGERNPSLQTLAHGQTVEVDETLALSSPQGALWIAADRPDTLFLLDETPLPVPLVPVSSQSWAVVKSACRVRGLTTSEILAHPDWLQAVTAFNKAAAVAALGIAGKAEAAEFERAERRDAQTEQNLADSMARFHRMLAPVPAPPSPELDFGEVYHLVSGMAPDPNVLKEKPETFEQFADRHQCRLYPLALTGQWWRRDRGALVAFLRKDGRIAALRMDWTGLYRLHVPGEKPRRVNAVVAASLKPEALTLSPPLPNKPLMPRDLIVMGLMLCRLDVGTLAFAALVAAVLGLGLPIATGFVIDTYIPSGMLGPTILLGIAVLVAQACSSTFNLASGILRLRMDGRIAERIGGGVMDRMMRLPTSLTRTMSSSDLASRVMSVDRVRRAVMNTVLNALMSGISGLSGVGILLYYNPLSGAVALGLGAVLVAAAIVAGFLQNKAYSQGEAMTAGVTSFALQIIENMSVLRSFAAESRAFARWAQNSAEMRTRGLRARYVSNGYEAFIGAFQTIAVVVIFAALGQALGAGGEVTSGGYMVFVNTFQSFIVAAMVLSRGINQVISLKMQAERAAPLLKTAPETPPSAKNPGTLSGALEVSNVSFGYGDRKILSDISFRCDPGSFVALVGPSGSGKSTLMSLLVGFEQPTGGSVLYDGRDLAGLDVTAVRRQIGYVRQNGKLFGGSLQENIVGPHKCELKDVWRAAEMSGIADDIRALPMGMHTVVTESGSAFSGGQAQRLLLARALVGSPKLLLLDEATSALDNLSQSVVARSIDSIGVTRIVVAHRLSTVRNANLILFLDGGEIKESGTFDDLIQRGGAFSAFARLQTL